MKTRGSSHRPNPIFSRAVQVVKEAMVHVEDEAVRQDLNRQLEQAERRMNDPYLKLSLIGDFSCGKSTLLNAMFGRDLLSMDMAPTTAVPTYIRWNREAEQGVKIVVHTRDGQAYDTLENGLVPMERYLGRTFDRELGPLIDALTTDNTLSGKISRVEIMFPHAPGREGICLIDTPGINPGMEGTRAHVEITRRLLSEEADAAIVLFPGSLVLTGELMDFLKESAMHLLRDSYFIITKFDLVRRQKDRELMPELVGSKMRELTGKEAKVYTVSAGMALDFYVDPAGAPSGAEEWARAFERDISEIFSDVARCRKRILKEHLRTLLRELTGRLAAEIQAGSSALEKERSNLERYSPERFAQEIKGKQREAAERLDWAERKYQNDIHAEAQMRFTGKKAKFRSVIMSKGSMGAVNSYLNKEMNKELQDIGPCLAQKGKELSRSLSQLCQEYEQSVRTCYSDFRVHIGRSIPASLETAGHGLSDQALGEVRISVGEETTVLSTVLDTVDSMIDILDDLRYLNLGSIVDDFAYMFGILADNLTDLFTPLQTKKERLCRRLDDSLSNSQAAVTQRYCEAAQPLLTHCRDLVEQLPRQYAQDYQKEFREAMDAAEVQRSQLKAELKERGRALSALREIEGKLERI